MKVSCSLAKCPRTKGKTSTKKKVMNRNKEKRVKESNSLLFNSQTISPHIAKGKNALKCIISETIRPQWNWFEKKTRKNNTCSNLQKQPKILNHRENDQTSIVITP